jgi:hypothetical protein
MIVKVPRKKKDGLANGKENIDKARKIIIFVEKFPALSHTG